MSRLPPAPDIGAAAREAAMAARAGRDGNAPPTSERTVAPSLARRDSAASDSSSGSSHSSHSSHQEREREAHLGEAPGGPPSVARGIAAAIAILLYLFAGQATGLWIFTRGFLLTRTTLEGQASTCTRPAQQSWALPRPASAALETPEQMAAWEGALVGSAECTLPARFGRTFLWIIDALRYDFIADAHMPSSAGQANTSWTPNPHYHNVLTLPQELNEEAGAFSVLAHFLADAPTTTLQRLKGLTTGSLPTFIDAGSNFAGSAVTEDTWLSQLKARSGAAGSSARMAILGDDTWLTVFPDVFDEDWRFPYESFNVEDIDGVDRGVKASVEPFLDGSNATKADWQLLVAHTLGVDHVGHRLGASHPRMREKLLEMQDFLKSILQRLPDDALFVLMGDHGMDERGDHGGDGELEVGAALWMYAKGQRRRGAQISAEDIEYVQSKSERLASSYKTFSPLPSPPFAVRGHRSIPQIDFVPTVSLLMGLPVPFNNLGSVIPEAFDSVDLYLRALRINALQVKTYLDAYAHLSSDLKPFQTELSSAWHAALRADFHLAQSGRSGAHSAQLNAAQAYLFFNRLAVTHARSVWAKFEYVKIALGLVILGLNVAALFVVKRVASGAMVEKMLESIVRASKGGLIGGAAVGMLAKTISLFALPMLPVQALSLFECGLGGAVVGSHFDLIARLGFKGEALQDWSALGMLLPLLHGFAFSSNSFIFHEEEVVLGLVALALLYRGIQGFVSSPVARLKARMPYFAVIACVALRLAAYSRVCREEHGPTCQQTFHADARSTLGTSWALGASYLAAFGLPSLIGRALATSKSNAGIAPLFLTWIVRPALMCGSGYWLIDWVLTSEGALNVREGTAGYAALDWAKLAIARVDFCIIGIIGLSIWIFSPLCLELTSEPVEGAALGQARSGQKAGEPKQKVAILGFANSFGSSYVLLFALVFAAHFLLAQPMGQISLGLFAAALLACLELGDAERDSALLRRAAQASARSKGQSAASVRPVKDTGSNAVGPEDVDQPDTLPISMLETSTLALMGFVAFFSTGHQATFVSIQWRTAFVGFRTLQYPFAPLFVIINSFGPVALLPAMAVPLLVLWNLAPKPRRGPLAQAPQGQSLSNGTQVPSDDPATAMEKSRMPTVMHILQASLSFLLYFTVNALASAIFATHFRRHLMLFKIWTPRFMLSAANLQLVYVGLILGLLAAGNIMSKVSVTFGSYL